MAAKTSPSGDHPDMDYKEHDRTYEGFLAGTRALVITCAVILIGMAIFLL